MKTLLIPVVALLVGCASPSVKLRQGMEVLDLRFDSTVYAATDGDTTLAFSGLDPRVIYPRIPTLRDRFGISGAPTALATCESTTTQNYQIQKETRYICRGGECYWKEVF